MMPIALLPDLAKTLLGVGGKLEPWERLVGLEVEVLRRARGAFLVQWFGRRVPERQLSLHVVFMNIAALKARYRQVRQSLPQPYPELNLIGPIAGAAGVLVGVFASVSGSFLFMPYLHEVFELLVGTGFWGTLVTMSYSLLGNWIMPLLGPALGVGLLAPLGIAMALGLALANDRTSDGIVRLMGNVAVMIDAFLTFWNQLEDPRTPIRNPLVRAVMGILDRMSALFAQVLGFAAIVLVRLAPLIPNLLAQFRAAVSLGEAVYAALQDIVAGFFDALMGPFLAGRGILDTLTGAYETILRLPEQLMEMVSELIEDATTVIGDAFTAIIGMISGYVEGVAERIVQGFHMTPLGWLIDRIMALVDLIPRFLAELRNAPRIVTPPPPPEPERGWLGSAWDWTKDTAADAYTLGLTSQIEDLQEAAGRLRLPAIPEFADLPDIPDLPTLPDASSLIGQTPTAPDLGDEALRLLRGATLPPIPEELLRRPRSAFAGQRPERPTLSDHERNLRDAIYLAVGRVLPAALRIHAPDLRALFDRVDDNLYPDAPRDPLPNLDHPQQTLPDSGRLAPRVGTLRIRTREGVTAAPDLRAFRDRLSDALHGQTYFVQATG